MSLLAAGCCRKAVPQGQITVPESKRACRTREDFATRSQASSFRRRLLQSRSAAGSRARVREACRIQHRSGICPQANLPAAGCCCKAVRRGRRSLCPSQRGLQDQQFSDSPAGEPARCTLRQGPGRSLCPSQRGLQDQYFSGICLQANLPLHAEPQGRL
jgi:hypothetical protein